MKGGYIVKIELVEVSVPKGTIERYKKLIIKGTTIITSNQLLFYIKESDLSLFLQMRNTKKHR